MIGFILAAVLAAAPGPKDSAKLVAPPSDVWLACKWHETWQSSVTLGAAHSESNSDRDYDKTYVFSPQKGTFSLYDPKQQFLIIENAIIGAGAILVDDQEHSESMLGDSSSRRQWAVSRSDLSVKMFGHTTTNVRMDDGRISTSQLLMNGTGACAITDPQPLAQTVPNKF